jgi:hypothetical protein
MTLTPSKQGNVTQILRQAQPEDHASRPRCMRKLVPIMTLATTVAVIGCGGVPKVGSISGRASPCVGVAKPGQASVTIYAKRDGKVVASRRVVLTRSPGNRYKLLLAPGTYVISAPNSQLPDRAVMVRTGHTITVNFLPSCK